MSDPLAPGAIFQERYEIVRCLKAGGMGTVYECIHIKTRKRRALKVMLPHVLADAGMRERFELEARVTAEIESDHIVETFDAGVDAATDAPFLVMELLRGDDLGAMLENGGPLPAPEVVRLLSQAAKALDQTHAAGIVHRDLKPENLFLATRGDGSSILKILDFGIAKVVADGNRGTHATAGIGSPLYMSPEQLTGDSTIGPQSDLYALGHIAFALLAGQGYWEEEQQAEAGVYGFLGRMIAGPKEAPTARAARFGVTLPAAFDPWFARATAKSPEDRFERASTMVAALARALDVAEPVSVARWAPPSAASALPSAADVPASSARAPQASPDASGRASHTVAALTIHGTTAATSGSARRARAWTPLAVAAVVALGAVAAGVMVWQARTTGPLPPDSAQPATSAIGVAAPAPPPSASPAASVPEVVPAAPAPTLAAQPPQPSATATAGPVRVRPPATSAPPSPGPASKARGCTPPYVIDAAGHKQYKPECL
jgi:serine/threonine-protein kinase